jgi:mono/diheme cytochrome c family protein
VKRAAFLLAIPMALWSVPAARAEADKDPPSYTKDVKPFLTKYCVNCHMGEKPKGGVTLDTYEGLTKNPKKKVVVAGKPTLSLLIVSMQAPGGDKKMPPKKEKTQPTAAEIAKIKAWITAGAKDDSDAGTMLPLGNRDTWLAGLLPGQGRMLDTCRDEDVACCNRNELPTR